jgi:hypothetical protein
MFFALRLEGRAKNTPTPPGAGAIVTSTKRRKRPRTISGKNIVWGGWIFFLFQDCEEPKKIPTHPYSIKSNGKGEDGIRKLFFVPHAPRS